MPEHKKPLAARCLETSGKKAERVKRLSEALERRATFQAGGRVDRMVPNKATWTSHAEFNVKLNLAIMDGGGFNKFYIIQVLQGVDGNYAAYNRWGRVGENGESKLYPCAEESEAIERFKEKFLDKTKNEWSAYKSNSFVEHGNKYTVVETEDAAEGEEESNPLGKLTQGQIEKGQAVLVQLKEKIISVKGLGGLEGYPALAAEVSQLSSQYYTYIPTTTVGRARPPALDNLPIIGEKESLLLFWLKMGFEDTTSTAKVGDNPLEGLLERPIPPTLALACAQGKVSNAGAIKTATTRGETLASKKAGSPIKPMDAERYGAIVLYTGDSIYRDLNQALRCDQAKVPKWLGYLRLFFESIACMPRQQVTLWRGIAADLYDEFAPGNEVTWWSVSSCTSDEMVARNFMNGVGGGASLIILDCKNAMDITPLSIYASEKERIPYFMRHVKCTLWALRCILHVLVSLPADVGHPNSKTHVVPGDCRRVCWPLAPSSGQ